MVNRVALVLENLFIQFSCKKYLNNIKTRQNPVNNISLLIDIHPGSNSDLLAPHVSMNVEMSYSSKLLPIRIKVLPQRMFYSLSKYRIPGVQLNAILSFRSIGIIKFAAPPRIKKLPIHHAVHIAVSNQSKRGF